MKRRDEVIVGVFVTAALLVGITGTLWLARRGFSKSYPLYARFDWGQNLKEGQQVLLAGVQVGFVDRVDLNPNGYIDVKMAVDKGRRIPEGSTVTVAAEGFFGDKTISITPCRKAEPSFPNEVIKGPPMQTRPDVPPPFSPPCRPGAFYAAGDTLPTGLPAPSVEAVLGRLDTIGVALGQIMQAVKVELVDQKGIQDLHHTIQSTNQLVLQLNQVAQEQSKGLTQTMTALRRSLNAIDSAAVDSTVQNMKATTEHLSNLTANLQQTTQKLDGLLGKLDNGDGTVAKLVNDPGVYNNLRSLLARLDSLTGAIKDNPKKYLNVKVF
ncbi:MAG TPA: MlaD family protein [Gemmatimonadaceae bacterium]|nr:MlaD family protein [Gemmatimonadaceae bacterium]